MQQRPQLQKCKVCACWAGVRRAGSAGREATLPRRVAHRGVPAAEQKPSKNEQSHTGKASISSIPGVSSLACPRANGVRASAVKGKGLSADSRHRSGRWKCESGAGCSGIRGRDTFRSHCGGDGSGRKRRTAAWETEGEWPERSRGEQAPAPEERASGRRPGQSWHSVQPQGPGSPPDGPWLDVACFHHWFFFFQKKQQISSGRFQIKMQPCFQTSL